MVVYRKAVSGGPSASSSRADLKCASLALPRTSTAPVICASGAGCVRAATGGVRSTITVRVASAVAPAASTPTSDSTYAPSASELTSQLASTSEAGAAVPAANVAQAGGSVPVAA